MRISLCLLGVMLCAASVQAQDPYWLEPMQAVHSSYTGGGGTISRFGDSITVSKAFFAPLRYGYTNTTPADDEALGWIHNYVTSTCWTWQDDPNQPQHGCQGGTTSAWPLESAAGWPGALGGERKVDYWLRNDNPEMAVIMWGTNDLHNFGITPAIYESNLQQVIQACKDNGTIPIITTIPPRSGYDNGTAGNQQRVADFVLGVQNLAISEQVPLIEYHDECTTRRPHNPPTDTWDGANAMWSAYSGYEVPTLISRDGIHPSNWSAGQSNFDQTEGLDKNGFNLRNWLTLHSTYEVCGQVIDAPPWTPFEIVHDIAYLGGGKYGYTFTIDGRDGESLSYFANMTFEGTGGGEVQQVQALGSFDVDNETDADSWDGVGDPPYDKDADSWFGDPFAKSPPASIVALTEAANYYHIEAGTGGGIAYDDAKLAYIVCSGDVQYSGVISRQAANFDVLGTILAPLPGDATLDGSVDGADYTLWADNYQDTGLGWGEGNFNGDDVVDGADYTIWADHYTGGGAIPEPATLSLLALAAAGLLRRRRR